MKFGSRRTILCAAAISAVCLIAAAFASGQAAQEPKPQMSEEVFKNVQVLKGIPVDQFMDTMGMISASIGMNCVTCHAAGNSSTTA